MRMAAESTGELVYKSLVCYHYYNYTTGYFYVITSSEDITDIFSLLCEFHLVIAAFSISATRGCVEK